MKKFKRTIGFALIALFTLAFISCEKDKDETPDYVGTWVSEELDDSFGEPMTITSTLILTASTFDMSISVDIGVIELVMGGMKGTLSVSGNQITIMPNSIGMADESGVMVWVNKGDDGWEEALDEMDMDEIETGTYSVEGDQLTITVDGEVDVFTRQ